MVFTANRLCGHQLITSDAKKAEVRDLIFDDQTWAVRYLVVRVRRLLNHDDFLLRPGQMEAEDWSAFGLRTPLSLNEIAAAPTLLTCPPVAKQGELEAARIIAWEAYWTGLFDRLTQFGDPHLRNVQAVMGHRVFGMDREVGRMDNFVIDDDGWIVRYLVVRLGSRPDPRRVMVDPHLVDAISWQDRSVWIRLPKESIEECEEFSVSH